MYVGHKVLLHKMIDVTVCVTLALCWIESWKYAEKCLKNAIAVYISYKILLYILLRLFTSVLIINGCFILCVSFQA